ncbi:MAG: hypothetical protein KatS3mg057_2303 [Herpetosiphonaceae bacterium]|nr:MAG: hypothetical protein KatS3mg057_2303 [Herpetosiphonaceae bacterium]
MESHELTFTIEGNYTDYQIQQMVAERIYALQGHQNQLYRVRRVQWIRPGLCKVTLYLPMTLENQETTVEQQPGLDELSLYEGPDEEEDQPA